MENKNKITSMIIFIALIVSVLQSCKKYPDGPLLSTHSRSERVVSTWKVDNYKKNDVDFTSLVSGYTETYTDAGSYFYEWGVLSGAGDWKFQNNDKEISITGTENQKSETLFILKLEEKQLWYYYMDGNDKKEFRMIQQ